MPEKENCSRCGSRLVSGVCPVCGQAGVVAQKRRPSPVPPGLYGAVGAVAGLVAFLFAIVTQPGNHRNRVQWPKHEGPVAQLSELHGQGTIYLVQLTPHKAAYSAEEMAQWLHMRYGLDARVLPPEPLPESAWDGWRRQYVAELLFARIKKDHPALAADKNAYLIGLTDADMFPVQMHWASTFTERDEERAAVISSATLTDRQPWWERAAQRKAADEQMRARMRRVLLKDVAMLYWHLPLNNDPSSLLHQPEDTDLPTEDIYESDLDPAATRWGQFEGDPCLFFRYSARTGLEMLPGRVVRSCSESRVLAKGDGAELFEVYLGHGSMVDRRTDVALPGTMPIAFERALRPGWSGDNPFGVSGTDGYDSYLSSRDNIYIQENDDDGMWVQLVRDPIWLSYLPLTRYVDTNYSGRYYAMRWRTTPYRHYDLRRYDGEVEAFLPCYTPTQFCYLNGVTEADGRALTFQRDGERRLLEVKSSDGDWLKLRYGKGVRIEEADDSRGQTVRYGYNEKNQLVSVTYASGETLSFAYDEANELTSFSASADGKTPAKVLLTSDYEGGLLRRQVLADGSTYSYSYGPVDERRTREAAVETPDGKTYTMRRYGNVSGVWETETKAADAPGGRAHAKPGR